MADYKVGQTIIAKIGSVPHEATIRAILDQTNGLFLIVDFGHEQVATMQGLRATPAGDGNTQG
jgi:hypothetical protein